MVVVFLSTCILGTALNYTIQRWKFKVWDLATKIVLLEVGYQTTSGPNNGAIHWK
jgi:hypothetical protein